MLITLLLQQTTCAVLHYSSTLPNSDMFSEILLLKHIKHVSVFTFDLINGFKMKHFVSGKRRCRDQLLSTGGWRMVSMLLVPKHCNILITLWSDTLIWWNIPLSLGTSHCDNGTSYYHSLVLFYQTFFHQTFKLAEHLIIIIWLSGA